MIYEEFELLSTNAQISKDTGRKLVTFRLQVLHSPVGEFLDGVSCAYDAIRMRDYLKGLNLRTFDWPEMITFGEWLSTILFPQPVRELLEKSLVHAQSQQKRLRLRLLFSGELHNIPWEYVVLNRGGGEVTMMDFLGLTPDVSIVRHQAVTLPVWEAKAELPVRMVVAMSSPAKYPALSLDREQEAIELALKENNQIQPVFIPGVTLKKLQETKKPYHLFHFAGHGEYEKEMTIQPGVIQGKSSIILEDEYGDPVQLSADMLAVQLRHAGVRVAVLGACNSGLRDGVNIWSSIASALLKSDLGAVVGMQNIIRDDSAIIFAQEFYKALIAGLTIDEAMTNGRISVSVSDACGWGTPVLYTRTNDGVIFPEYAGNKELEDEREKLRVKVHQRIKELNGRLTGIRVGKMERGIIDLEQKIDTIRNGGKITGVDINDLKSGSLTSSQEIDRVEKGGTVTGIKIDQL